MYTSICCNTYIDAVYRPVIMFSIVCFAQDADEGEITSGEEGEIVNKSYPSQWDKVHIYAVLGNTCEVKAPFQ